MQPFITGTIRTSVPAIDALRAAQPAFEEMRAVDGVLEYTFSADPVDEHLVHVCERYEDDEALARHLEVPAMQLVREQMAGWGVVEMSLRRFAAEDRGPLVPRRRSRG